MLSSHQDFRCSISQLIMLDPVSDILGEIYEREEIEAWFNQCKKEGKPFTSPSTNETLHNDQLIPARKIKVQISNLLDNNPELWAEVYLSKIAHTKFKNSLKSRDKKALEELITQEPRFLTLNTLELIKWVIEEQNLSFLKDVVVPNLFKRGQKDRVIEVALLIAEAEWLDGLRTLIAAQNWDSKTYFTNAIKWIHAQKIKGLKVILHEMQYQKIDLNTPDDQGNTLLHEAAKAGHAEIVTLLLLIGIDTKLKNQNGFTAEELATQANHSTVVQAFKGFQIDGISSNQQIKGLQAEIQELKSQVAELKAQFKQETRQLSKGLRYTALPFFTLLAKNVLKSEYFCSRKKIVKADGNVSAIAQLPNGHVISSTDYGIIKIWDVRTWKCLKTIEFCKNINDDEFDTSELKLYVLSNKQVLFTSSSEDFYLLDLDLPTEKCLKKISQEKSIKIRAISQPNGTIMASGVIDDTNVLGIWSFEKNKWLKTLKFDFPMKEFIYATSLPNGNFIIGLSVLNKEVDENCYNSINSMIVIWDSNEEKILHMQRIDNPDNSVYQLKEIVPFSDGQLLLLGTEHQYQVREYAYHQGSFDKIHIYNVENAELQELISSEKGKAIEKISIMPDGKIVLLSGYKLQVFDLEDFQLIQSIDHTYKHALPLLDGQLVTCSQYDSNLEIFELTSTLKQIKQANESIANEVPECKIS